ncbi:MAG: ATP-binding protein [Janthinobacterium lividum]
MNEIDWKADLSSDKVRLTEHLCSFANYPGGAFFAFGINNGGVPIGVDTFQVEVIVSQLTNLGRDAVEPALALDYITINFRGTAVLFIFVPESPIKPVHRRGKPLEQTYIRSGGSTRLASRQEVGTMLLQSRTPHWEELHASTLQSEDELLEMLSIEPISDLLEQPPPRSREAAVMWLAGESFVDRHPSGGGYITNLGAIAAARKLNLFPDLSRKAARVIVYRGTSKEQTRQETEGTMGYALSFQRLMLFVTQLLPQSEVIEQALRQTKTIYPEVALREVIANALIHQDFSISGAGPLIEIFDDRIEISNPGRLLPSKRLNRLIGTQPESRNERLARAFRRYRICEERGSGLIKAGTGIELYGLPPIQFEEGTNHFKVTLFAPRTFAQMTVPERLNACYQHAQLRYFSGSAMTNKSLRERLKMPERQRSMVSVLIQDAVDAELIVSADPENKSRKFAEYIPSWARAA